MIEFVLGLFVALGPGSQSNANAPLAPICFSLSDPKAKLPVEDVVNLKKNWKSKDFQILPSGNFGQYKNGSYYIITKESALLKQLDDRFSLAMKVLKLGGGGNLPRNLFPLQGIDFNEKELDVLSRLIQRWAGSNIPAGQLSQAKRLLFDLRSVIRFANQGETISISPTIQFQSYEAQQEFASGMKQKAGLLVEPDFETSNNHRYGKDGPIIGTESTEGSIYTKIQNAYGTDEDFPAINATLVELLGRIYQSKFSAYRLEILKASMPFQKSQSYLFPNMDQITLTEDEQQKTQRSVVMELQKHGYTSQEAESRGTAMKYSGRDITIDFITGIKLFGTNNINGPCSVRIWP